MQTSFITLQSFSVIELFMLKKKKFFISFLLPIQLSAYHMPISHAAITLQDSRVILDGDKKSASLLVTNQNADTPYLAQGWIEDADNKKINGPLVLLPPLQRIEAGAQTQIKLQTLPTLNLLRQDQETLFYLNLREIPPRNNTPGTLNIALQNRIKVFYRPLALKAPRNTLATPWQSELVMKRDNDTWTISNPSAYFITLVDAQTRKDSASVPGFTPVMIAPHDSERLTGRAADYGNAPVLTYLNDYGGRPVLTFSCSDNRCKVVSNMVPKS